MVPYVDAVGTVMRVLLFVLHVCVCCGNSVIVRV